MATIPSQRLSPGLYFTVMDSTGQEFESFIPFPEDGDPGRGSEEVGHQALYTFAQVMAEFGYLRGSRKGNQLVEEAA